MRSIDLILVVIKNLLECKENQKVKNYLSLKKRLSPKNHLKIGIYLNTIKTGI